MAVLVPILSILFLNSATASGCKYVSTKKTKMNVRKTGMEYGVGEGEIVKVPTLDASRWVYELEVAKTVMCGESDTFFCGIKNIQIDSSIDITDGIDLTCFDPVIYSGHYHSIGSHLEKIGDFL